MSGELSLAGECGQLAVPSPLVASRRGNDKDNRAPRSLLSKLHWLRRRPPHGILPVHIRDGRGSPRKALN
eukprot:3565698-Pleurochrysis_carterae.AAC.3